MTKKELVKITNQSFQEAGGLEVFSDLEMVDIISAEASITGCREPVAKSANEELIKEAKKNEMSHVFRVKYTWGKDCSRHPSYGTYHTCFAIGTGYKKK